MIGILRLLDRTGHSLVLPFVAKARLREVDWSVLVKQTWFPNEYDNGVLISLKDAEPLKLVCQMEPQCGRTVARRFVRYITMNTNPGE